MAYEQRADTGTLFPVEERTSEDDPTSSGKINIDGKDYYLDAWILRDPGRDRSKDTMDLRFKAKGSSRASGDGHGTMQRVDKTGKSDKYPDWKGELKLEASGMELEVSGWIKQPSGKKPFLSLSVKPLERSRADSPREAAVDDTEPCF